ncbi:hypothetical protein H8S90_17415 [Olivibacter sp. SDN3]|uniref:hypothetical protein n=1 Tax=Olivibacter sp. SDN3 TaxID=2764720 RepID=UPI00165124D0|nr:hypothetical protein [Olivibacter sp. SDN3]QNL48554.1 hypothetical protein H8S90_17415 [Olivibacter sp. SDN3]
MKVFNQEEHLSVINAPSTLHPDVMISVFKTNVCSLVDAQSILRFLYKKYPDGMFNFDLEDHDRVFRIAYHQDIISDVVTILKERNFMCEIL